MREQSFEIHPDIQSLYDFRRIDSLIHYQPAIMCYDILEMMNSAPLHHYPRSGITVLIVGTGFGGLTAALECYRKGHDVRILERNQTTDTSGMPCIATIDTC